MERKTDMRDLVRILERVCEEYLAMRYILDHYHPDGTQWVRQLADSRKAVAPRRTQILGEIRAGLQFGRPEPELLESVKKALNQLTTFRNSS